MSLLIKTINHFQLLKVFLNTSSIINIDFLHSPNHLLSQKYDIDYCEKVKMFYNFIRFRKEVSIAYVGHNRFISEIANNQNKIERCHPYLFELVMRDYCDN